MKGRGFDKKGEGVAWFNNSLFTEFAEEMALKKKRAPPSPEMRSIPMEFEPRTERGIHESRSRPEIRARATEMHASAAMRVLQNNGPVYGESSFNSQCSLFIP
ncbi:hypothetical protein CEXT_31451 [Caerostris extrusa]|uniref:Uncharacterized protein n=1 Tax=Caerostris extrusa TaxID=172846 RepID=A0AAV4T0Y0_CAEEX|nr:hypothetical protein CEXT_31451 [Caerostris extrusa]